MALVFVPQYIQLKPKGAGVTLYFTTEFMQKNQRPNQVNDPWYIPAVPTGKPGFGALNCPVRALRYMTEHPELRNYSFERQQCGQGAQCSLDFSIDLHHHSGFSCLSLE